MILFLYGSLRDDNLRDVVFSDTLTNTRIANASAHNYATYQYPGESFPVLLPEQNSYVNGIVLFDPSEEALARMAFFEGDEYEIDKIDVILTSGEKVTAQYNRALELDGLAFDTSWNYEQWLESDSRTLIKITREYMKRCWGFMDTTAADKVWQEIKQDQMSSN